MIEKGEPSLKKFLFVRILLCLLFVLLILSTSAFPQASQHEKIVLKGFDGTELTTESKAPYSPKKTCGSCHDYDRITNGYHFQQGRTDGTGKIVVSDTFDLKAPWNLSSGMYGKHGLASADSSQLAKKTNSSPSDIDKSSFYFVQHCGACHPGGGPGEYDRKGNPYYNEETKKFGNEPFESGFLLDGDYSPYSMGDISAGAAWDKSGPSEADCLICHLRGYRWKERGDALKERFFKYGPTVGAGWGVLRISQDGSQNVKTTEVAVDYSKKEVADFENLHLQIVRKPPDENCWSCHSASDGKMRGLQWSPETDVHKARDIGCVVCHPGDKDHNFAKGNTLQETVRDDLDNSMNSCEDCHMKGKDKKAPRYKHPFSPRHMKRLACETCHIPFQSAPADLVYDLASTGTAIVYDSSRFLTNDPLDPKKSVQTTDPVLLAPQMRDFRGRIVPVKSLIVLYWGDLDEKTNVVRPIPLWKIRRLKKPVLKDDDGDGIAEINTLDEIKTYLKVLRTNDSYGNPIARHPVLMKGGLLYHLDKKGEVEKIKHEKAQPIDLSLSHNVASGDSVIGSRGCSDCHSKNSSFFLRKILIDPYDEKGKPVYIETWERLGFDKEKLDRLLMVQ